MMKKMICALLGFALCASLFAACEKKTAGDEPTTELYSDATTVPENTDATQPAATTVPESDSGEETAPVAEASAAPAETVPFETAAKDDFQNPVMNFIGNYTAGAYTVTVGAVGDTDAEITVTRNNEDGTVTEWTMSGTFNPDVFRINYSDSVKKTVTYNENGEVSTENVEYEDGVGRIQFHDDYSLSWQDEQEADDVSLLNFEYAPVGDAGAEEAVGQ